MTTYQETANKYFEKLDMFSLAITRAHGKNHPEARPAPPDLSSDRRLRPLRHTDIDLPWEHLDMVDELRDRAKK